MKIEFLIVGSPIDAFYSQVAMFRLALDALGDLYRRARVLLYLVDGPSPTPPRWVPWFDRIEIRWADQAHAEGLTHGRELFAMVDADADLSVICDADTMLLQPLPEEFMQAIASAPALCGVVAHTPPLLHNFDDAPPLTNTTEMWQKMGKALGCSIETSTPYLLAGNGDLGPSFYINHAFVAGPPDLIRRLGELVEEVRPAMESVLVNEFSDQVAIALAVEVGSLPIRQLPMRYNFPNDATADRLYPEEMKNIILMHYLRFNAFDRHTVFATKSMFDQFMALTLKGSNAVFQDAVRRLTNGVYPFGDD